MNSVMGNTAFLELSDVHVEFIASDRSRIEALLAVDLSIRRNEFLTLLGASGCGKSTLIKIIAGLLEPDSGRVSHHAKEPLTIGYVCQESVLMPWRTVIQNVTFPLEIGGKLSPATLRRAHELLALVGLTGFERTKPYELSGGMQQRVAIARALVHDPHLLLMDEPFGALDALTREELGFELLNIWTQFPKTIVFVTHSITEAVTLSDRCAVMSPRPGRIAETIDIDLPRPRTPEMQYSEPFKEFAQRIRGHIYGGRRSAAA
jgi:NitT/TauT family transport system ATP-binding protein